MVTTVNKSYGDGQVTNHSKALIVEMVGPAGAGKTTLSRTLCQDNNGVVMGREIELRKIGQIPTFLRTVPALVPHLLRVNDKSRSLTWDETKAIVFLTGWHRIFRQQADEPGSLVLLDHGPVFKLAMLHAFGPDKLRDKSSDDWWELMFKQWASELDMVIWLDAPNPVLESRINARNQRHPVKGKSDLEMGTFLERYRRSYEYILAKLAIYQGPRVLSFDTSQTEIDTIIKTVKVTANLLLSSP